MARQLLILNGFAVIAAALNHAVYRVLPAILAGLTPSTRGQLGALQMLDRPSLIALQILDQVAVMAVPAFLFVSGIFISISTSKRKRSVEWATVINRILHLLIPYAFWSLLLIGLNLYIGTQYGIWDLLMALFVQGVLAPYYYVPMIVIFLLISPFLVPFARDKWKITLGVFALIQLSFPLLEYGSLLNPTADYIQLPLNVMTIWRAPINAFWFVLGMVVGFHQAEFRRLLQNIRPALVPLLLILMTLYTVEVHFLAVLANEMWIAPQFTFLYQLASLALLVTYLAFGSMPYPFSAEISRIGVMSFGIYLIHFPVQMLCNRLLLVESGYLISHPLLRLLVLVAVGIAIPAALYLVVEHLLGRRMLRFVFG